MITDSMSRRTRTVVVALVALLAAAAGLWWVSARETAPMDGTERRAEVAERGAAVMPFDLAKTTHSFAPTPDGGRQAVTANDPADTTQTRLIRDHLSAEATKFTAGDFTDPATIHGDQMPGLAELRAGASRLTVRYEELPTGATLHYTSTDPALIAALHRWFDAQSSDHGTNHHAHDVGVR
ncbi:aspartate carbamoyltransferase [Nocardia cyriacigeorgica]|uniref:Aspartate carbamoyltransferase n=1 Tax=Nocardia cyriacigeorgica TaxID=135487 RepID=A0ABX0CHT1_9NOCA|nr:aspartate carbamoyltransferase [Nocardia cyriacigeorgica]NEW37722.1 aspartate carbamoyltransferase [Nocardia cyriacigeorgica]NEW48892.1 aspartate carbamoyltransferase [Nocardia cyriacigeorgica]NEW56104.1 aspartate carbamoyltransferase [Nocardia cyriacigeorgica]